jgi:hypothetical protein
MKKRSEAALERSIRKKKVCAPRSRRCWMLMDLCVQPTKAKRQTPEPA